MTTPEGRLADLLFRADRLAAGYDYDGAIELLKTDAEFSGSAEAAAAITEYEGVKSTLVEQNVNEITHVFFHTLVMDTAKAFDGDREEKGYNQVMTTKSEFDKILNEMYNRGFVLVRLHDIAHEETDENGNTRMVKGKIMLPEGKKAFVMSQDDVCYYPYMEDDGFARRIVIGEDGKPTCEMVQEDGSVATGSYDLVPILEDFIQEHPDFSYQGARAVLAFTGYEGILGYRTAASYQESNPNYEADRQAAAAVAQCLKDNGWELASHSWGHRYLGQIEYESFKTDTDKWEAEVESLIGPTDIILYPFGDDISDWHGYTSENDRFNYLYGKGFRYFCNVDSSQYWVQIGDDYVRQGRRNLDGYRMWQDIAASQEGGSGKRRLDDLFRAEDVFDPARPTPVEWE
ncbi:MAG: polysaccharide deacetylase [Lachnospiraceae bacterium]|nr:polysaccharide deacetylase [Lachnospiraceae bacterium]